MTSDTGIIIEPSSPHITPPSHIVVNNENLLLVTSTGVIALPHHFHLNNVLVSPGLIKNLVLVRLWSLTILVVLWRIFPLGDRSLGVIASVPSIGCSSRSASALLVATSPSLWHQRLTHPSHEVLSKLAQP